MSKKVEKLNIFLTFALRLATLSKCSEGSVAAIIVSSDMQQVYSIGINGGAGNKDCLCHLGDKYKCLHAEINAIIKCTVDLKRCNTIMFCTKAPCVTCAAAIINSGIKSVFYYEAYKATQGVQLLVENGINVQAYDESAYGPIDAAAKKATDTWKYKPVYSDTKDIRAALRCLLNTGTTSITYEAYTKNLEYLTWALSQFKRSRKCDYAMAYADSIADGSIVIITEVKE